MSPSLARQGSLHKCGWLDASTDTGELPPRPANTGNTDPCAWMSGFSAVDLKYSTPPERLRPQLSTPGWQVDGMGVEPSGMDGAPTALARFSGLMVCSRLMVCSGLILLR
ncbi:MAG: hypothetical protein AB8E74_08925, partial [Prochlorococcus sp.]